MRRSPTCCKSLYGDKPLVRLDKGVLVVKERRRAAVLRYWFCCPYEHLIVVAAEDNLLKGASGAGSTVR